MTSSSSSYFLPYAPGYSNSTNNNTIEDSSSSSLTITKHAIRSMFLYPYDQERRKRTNGFFHPVVQVLEIEPVLPFVDDESGEEEEEGEKKNADYDMMAQKKASSKRSIQSKKRYNLIISDSMMYVRAYVEQPVRPRKDGCIPNIDNNLRPNMLIRIHRWETQEPNDESILSFVIQSFRIISCHNPTLLRKENRATIGIIGDPQDMNHDASSYTKFIQKIVTLKDEYETDLGDCYIGFIEARILASALEQNRTLQEINLEENPMSDAGTQLIVNALRHSPSLTSLNLSSNLISYSGIKSVAQLLQHNQTLTELILNSNRIGARGATLLASVLENNNTTLEKLEVANGSITLSGIKGIAKMLTINKTLVSLNLGGNSIGDEELITIAMALRYNRTLYTLDVHSSKIGNDSIVYLAKEFKYNIHLLKIFIQDNVFDDNSTFAIYKSMEWNATIRTIVLDPKFGRYEDDNNDDLTNDNNNNNNNNNNDMYDNSVIKDIIESVTEYNNTLKYFDDPKVPYELKGMINSYYTRVSSKKGQRQKYDIIYWLLQNQEQWCILLLMNDTRPPQYHQNVITSVDTIQ